MALSIKNERVENLVRNLANQTGETLTEAILIALEERLQRLKGQRSPGDLFHEIMTISERCAHLPDLDPRTPEEILGYDETGGLPW